MHSFFKNTLLLLGITSLTYTHTLWSQEATETPNTDLSEKQARITSILLPVLEKIPHYLLAKEETLAIDISSETLAISELYEGVRFSVEWNIEGLDTPLTSSQVQTTFQQAGTRNILFNLYESLPNPDGEEETRTSLLEYEIPLFVYEQSIPTIGSSHNGSIENIYEQEGVLLYPLLSEEGGTLSENQTFYQEQISGPISDYILFLGEVDDIDLNISIFHDEHIERPFGTPMNIIVLSNDHPQLIKRRTEVSLAGAEWVENAFAVESIATRTITKTLSYEQLTETVTSKQHEGSPLGGQEQTISLTRPLLLFINTAFRSGATQKEVYLLIILPIILSGIAIMRNLIGFTSVGIFLPTFLTLALVYTNSWYVLVIYACIVFGHIILKKITPTSTLLHTPKMVFLLIITLLGLFIIFAYGSLIYGTMQINILDIIFIALGILTMEYIISAIWGKEWSEAWEPIIYTAVYSAIMALVLNIQSIQTWLMIYPEILFITLFIAIYLARYRGLRMTEYFRFRTLLHDHNHEE